MVSWTPPQFATATISLTLVNTKQKMQFNDMYHATADLLKLTEYVSPSVSPVSVSSVLLVFPPLSLLLTPADAV